jgi:LacI family transcriptional regulator
LGLRNFAYCGAPPDRFNGWVNERERAFREFVEAAGFQCKTFKGRYRPANHWKRSQAELGKWLTSLPRPVGLFGCNDSRARNVLQACHSVGLNVPEDIAVIGVDNDDIMCELSRPPLTSIEQGAIRIGFEAAMILNSLRSGKQPPDSTAIAPEGVVVRRSTERLATDDEDVAKALRFIRAHACRPIRVRDVLEVVAVSRSTLESRFREMIGRSIHCEIRRVQIERAIHLLRSTHLSMKRVSHEVGASSVQYFTSMVREHTGKTPGQIRKEALR